MPLLIQWQIGRQRDGIAAPEPGVAVGKGHRAATIFTQMADQLACHENIQLFHGAYRMRPARA